MVHVLIFDGYSRKLSDKSSLFIWSESIILNISIGTKLKQSRLSAHTRRLDVDSAFVRTRHFLLATDAKLGQLLT